MKKKKDWDIWGLVARIILRNRIILLLGIIGMTCYWGTQWKYMQFTFSEANLLPDNHPENLRYKDFVQRFGEEGNVMVIALKDTAFFTPPVRNAWRQLNKELEAFTEIAYVLST